MLLLKLYDCVSLLTSDDFLHHWLVNSSRHRAITNKKENWTAVSRHQLNLSLKILNSDKWTAEKNVGSDVIFSKNVENIGKVFKFEVIINSDVENVKRKIFENFENVVEWNNNIQEARILKQIDSKTNITQSITKSYSALSSREFVHLRQYDQINDGFFLTCVSINHPNAPEASNVIRAEHRLLTYFLYPVKNAPHKTHFICMMNVNLKGWMPQTIVDKTLSMGILDHIKDLRACLET